MAYFSQLAPIKYNGKTISAIDRSILIRALNNKKPSTGASDLGRYQLYHVRDGQTPEGVSDELYGTGDYWWIVLYFSKAINYYDWPPASATVDKYLPTMPPDTYVNVNTDEPADHATTYLLNKGLIDPGMLWRPISQFEKLHAEVDDKRTLILPTKRAVIDIIQQLHEINAKL